MIRQYPSGKEVDFGAIFSTKGCYAVVGAGGKTTTCFAAAKFLCGLGYKVVVTTTTHMMWEEGFVPEQELEKINPLLEHRQVVFTGGEVRQGKVTAISEEALKKIRGKADYVLVEADGSARHPLKAPADHEPALPQEVDFLVAVGGLSALGQPISEACHRVEQVCGILQEDQSAILTPKRMANILWEGYGKIQLPVIFLLNQAEGRWEEAEEVAAELDSLSRKDCERTVFTFITANGRNGQRLVGDDR